MEKVRPRCGQPSDRGRLKKRRELVVCGIFYAIFHSSLCCYLAVNGYSHIVKFAAKRSKTSRFRELCDAASAAPASEWVCRVCVAMVSDVMSPAAAVAALHAPRTLSVITIAVGQSHSRSHVDATMPAKLHATRSHKRTRDVVTGRGVCDSANAAGRQ